MDIITPKLFEMSLPLAAGWAAEQERMILESGTPLNEQQLADARALGVRAPERVRWLEVEEVLGPKNPILAKAAAENDTDPERRGYLTSLSAQMEDLRGEVVVKLVEAARRKSE